MFDILCLIIIAVDSAVIAGIVALICELLLGDAPFARLIRLILSIIGGIAYFLFGMYVCWGETDISIGGGLFVLLFPIGILAIVKIIQFMYSE